MATNREPLRIGCFSGFWGDSASGAFQLVQLGQIHYLVGDYLSEVTMGILAKSKVRKSVQIEFQKNKNTRSAVNVFLTKHNSLSLNIECYKNERWCW
jgi:hypothetical protein